MSDTYAIIESDQNPPAIGVPYDFAGENGLSFMPHAGKVHTFVPGVQLLPGSIAQAVLKAAAVFFEGDEPQMFLRAEGVNLDALDGAWVDYIIEGAFDSGPGATLEVIAGAAERRAFGAKDAERGPWVERVTKANRKLAALRAKGYDQSPLGIRFAFNEHRDSVRRAARQSNGLPKPPTSPPTPRKAA